MVDLKSAGTFVLNLELVRLEEVFYSITDSQAMKLISRTGVLVQEDLFSLSIFSFFSFKVKYY